MKQKRRNVLKGGVALAAASFLPATGHANAHKSGDTLDLPTHTLHESIVDHFEELGYALGDQAPIVTGDESFNGGLRYDESEADKKPGQMAIQACARLEDIRKKDQMDVLPLFHIFYCITPLGLKPADTLAQALGYLTNVARLDTQKFAFVTIPEFEPHLPVMEELGFDTGRQIHFRNSAKALEEGDSSGFFRFPGNPSAEAFATVGIYYWTGSGEPPKLAEYPPQPGWTEIGEASIDESDIFGFGIGTERLGLAMTGDIPLWQERLVLLFEQIERNSGGKPPPGKDIFANG
ncbi:MAG: hypothetical protein GY789_13290 [Hyphomicrobiales bacterium]|nr:hypothetical protein [Hyphomicrobiales bacterium]MCP5001317.1 hypothetical protein [Hyphomicrobiales bacterium]